MSEEGPAPRLAEVTEPKDDFIDEPTTSALSEQPPAAPDGVLIVVSRTEDGGVSTDVSVLGDVRLSEVQTLLALASAKWNAKLGL